VHVVQQCSAGGIIVQHGVDAYIIDSRSNDRRLLTLLMLAKHVENHVNVGGHLLLEPRQLPTNDHSSLSSNR